MKTNSLPQPRLLNYDLGPGVTVFSTTRQGGYSQGSYGEMNVNAYCGDDQATVAKNRELLSNALGLSNTDRLVVPHQVHGTGVVYTKREEAPYDAAAFQTEMEGKDIVMTDEQELCIGVSTADCVPIVLYDPNRHCAAVVHAGWRGTAKKAVLVATSRLSALYAGSTSCMQAVIGPCISQKNFEVGQEVYDAFCSEGFPMDRVARLMPANDGNGQKWHVDLPLCNRLLLEQAGVEPGHIYDCGICTYDNSDRFFSARRMGINSGRIFTGIVLH